MDPGTRHPRRPGRPPGPGRGQHRLLRPRRPPDEPRHAVRLAASAGGDCDTIAALTGAVTGACHGVGAFPGDACDTLVHPNRSRPSTPPPRLSWPVATTHDQAGFTVPGHHAGRTTTGSPAGPHACPVAHRVREPRARPGADPPPGGPYDRRYLGICHGDIRTRRPADAGPAGAGRAGRERRGPGRAGRPRPQ
ncbi:ADP-ribosylglycohydrolase family protein [Streptomyces sp. CG1]|uniref:ADP-ribosylglycohydrolase family protein n=1 Tax=Streptomyces sp. CG1 TaxID=1287523 RepID=UPI0034E220D0